MPILMVSWASHICRRLTRRPDDLSENEPHKPSRCILTGIIEYTRGAVEIVNRKKLEDSACECYGVIRQYDGELGLK